MSTVTSKFGVSGRESHDSSPFYSRFDATQFNPAPSPLSEAPDRAVDKIFCGSSKSMTELPDGCVSLMATSPPYHVGKEYDTDVDFDEYLDMLITVFTECYRVLQPGGRAAINLANLGRKPYIPLTTYIDAICHEIGFLPRAQIVWVKAKGASGSCAWGTFESAKNPVLRDVHEYIMVYSKGQFGRAHEGTSTISKREFLRDTLSVWEFPPESAKRIGHPAPFPLELPRRLINLYSYKDDLVLDPFMGSGTTAVAALEAQRHYVGYETSPEYVSASIQRIDQFKKERDRKRDLAATRRERDSNDRERINAQNRASRASRCAELKARVDSIKLDSGCVDCGYNFSSVALDFDHIKGDKIDNVSQMIYKPDTWAHIQEEIDKCVVRCSNCHRIKTHKKEEEEEIDGCN